MNENDIIKELKQLDNNVNDVIVPLLKDTIEKKKKIVFKLIFVVILLIFAITGISVYAQITISKQIDKFNKSYESMLNKYNEFLSQFEFEDSTIYQNATSNEGDTVINDGIKYNEQQ